MLGRFSSALQNAVDALAPPPPLHEDFAYHWKRLMKHYLDVTKSKQVPIELTNIPSHIEQLLKILLKEDEGNENGSMGPCLEYLLQHSLLDLLVTLAETDDPPGMRQHVLNFISKFLTQIRAPVVGHTSVYPPLLRLVGVCDGSTPTPTEVDEVQFLLGLTALIRRNTQLLPIFTTQQTETSVRRESCSSDASSQFSMLTSVGSDCQQAASYTPPPHNNPLFSTPLATGIRAKSVRLVPPEIEADVASDDARSLVTEGSATDDTSFPLIDSILSYLDSPDSKVRVKACQALMLLVSLQDDRLANTIANDTLSCIRIASRLADLYTEIPHKTEPNHIEDLTVSWGLDVPLSPCVNCDGCRQVTSFLSWFDFCDQVIAESHKVIAESLCTAIRDRFFDDMFPPPALESSLNLTIISKCFSMAASPLLNSAICSWLVGSEMVKLTPGVKPCPVLEALLNNWKHSEYNIVVETLRLFELFLEKGNEHLMNNLVYLYLKDKSYLEHSNCDNHTGPSLEAQIENKETRESSTEEKVEDNSNKTEIDNNKTEIDEIILSFLSVVPYELRSGAESGYEQYVSESQRQYSEFATRKEHYTSTHNEKKSNNSSTVFYEGPFLRTLFQAIRNISHQEYQVNLELTAIVSRLALDPNKELNEYLLDTKLKVKAEASTLISCLRYVATSLAGPITANLDYRRLLKETREFLLSGNHYQRYDWSGIFECVIVLEELCKELAAIAYVKNRHTLHHTS